MMAPKSKKPWTRHAEYLELKKNRIDETDFCPQHSWSCLKHLFLDVFVPIGRCIFFLLDIGLDCWLAYLYFRGEYQSIFISDESVSVDPMTLIFGTILGHDP